METQRFHYLKQKCQKIELKTRKKNRKNEIKLKLKFFIKTEIVNQYQFIEST